MTHAAREVLLCPEHAIYNRDFPKCKASQDAQVLHTEYRLLLINRLISKYSNEGHFLRKNKGNNLGIHWSRYRNNIERNILILLIKYKNI